MSGAGDELKKPLYWLVKQDSRAASQVGRTLGWDYLVQEGKRNQDNPGRAITKAAAAAAAWYLGGAAGGLLGGGGEGAAVGADAAGAADGLGSGLGAASDASSLVGASTNDIAASAIQNAGYEQGLLGQAGGLSPETLAGQGGMGVAQNGIGPGTGWNSLRGAMNNPSLASLRNAGSNLFSGGAGGSSKTMAQLELAKSGLQMMSPQQPQPPAPQQRMGGGGGQQAPLALPYGNAQNNSMGMPPMGIPPGMSYAEWLKRRQQGLL